MKVKIFIPGWGATVQEAESVESELAALKAKYPDKAGEITVEVFVPKQNKYSDTELSAMDEE